LPLPLVEPPVAELLLLEPPDALDVELDDEHADVRASSMTAAAPAVGTAKDRFIPTPSRDFCGFGCRSWVAASALG